MTITHDERWTEVFKRLQTYQQEHEGSCNVPRIYPTKKAPASSIKSFENKTTRGYSGTTAMLLDLTCFWRTSCPPVLGLHRSPLHCGTLSLRVSYWMMMPFVGVYNVFPRFPGKCVHTTNPNKDVSPLHGYHGSKCDPLYLGVSCRHLRSLKMAGLEHQLHGMSSHIIIYPLRCTLCFLLFF